MSDHINDAVEITTNIFGEDDLIRRADAVEALAGWNISPIVLMPVPSVEQKHGTWDKFATYKNNLNQDRASMNCSLCHEFFDGYPNILEWHYCPHCGAKMDGEQD